MTSITTNLNPIDAIKHAAAEYILSHKYFSNVPVMTDEAGDLDTKVAKAIKAIGLSVVIEAVTGNVQFPSVGSQAIDIDVTITIEENVLINRDENNPEGTGKRATDVVCELFAIFNPNVGVPLPLRLESFDLIGNMGSKIIYQLTGKASAGWKLAE